MRNKFNSLNRNFERDCDMLEVCRLLCDYGSLLDIEYVIFEMNSFSTLKIEYTDINELVIVNDITLEIKTDYSRISIIIDEISSIEIE